MGFRSFKSVEKNDKVTLPNGLSVVRGAGGVALGVGLATGSIDPALAVMSAGILAASDAEGSLISATRRLPRLQKVLHIIPSTLGRKLDPVMDKLFTVSVLVGANVGGQVPIWQGASIVTAEVATSVATLVAEARGTEPQASKIGKIGMVMRCGVIAADLTASAVGIHSGLSHELLADSGDGLAATAIGLGLVSCGQLVRQARQPVMSLPMPELMP